MAADLLTTTEALIAVNEAGWHNDPPDKDRIERGLAAEELELLKNFRLRLSIFLEALKKWDDQQIDEITTSFLPFADTLCRTIEIVRSAEQTGLGRAGLMTLGVGGTALLDAIGVPAFISAGFSFGAIFGPGFADQISRAMKDLR